MSLLLFSDPFEYSRPSRILDQHFGLGLDPEDLLSPLIPREMRHLMRCPAGYLRPWRSAASQRDTGSTVTFDKDKFQANLDVQQFKPEEISVKVNDNTITIEGKHEEKEDEHGFISRHFVRRYVLPKDCDVSKVESRLSTDGVLSITAPKICASKETERSIPVVQTGQPSKAVENKEEKKKEK
ncbi:protein lethal(2)essential for life [Tribolium castaneum]|uniref:Protein lethal(2)essential for life-like Protein n=1 Tax=Tribolium castaneum TaxID=7070 RepID=D6WV46_TRICA|nr:PREDICTED: protein lethal(2)essential for life [Tribolium castaneum]EFA09076.1 Protein lethal(2)essential for life-like Protein [Tribolium castaneum]|eukprot:XP_974390.1 PREDICTED: protein lethal(2)essential for life [Tribolium castaneum]